MRLSGGTHSGGTDQVQPRCAIKEMLDRGGVPSGSAPRCALVHSFQLGGDLLQRAGGRRARPRRCSSCDHCFRKLAGTISRMRRRCSAQRCAMTRLASIVLPRPTSSARITPFEIGDASAKSGIDLMRVEVYPRRRKRFRKRVIRRAFKGNAVSEVLAVIGGEIRRFLITATRSPPAGSQTDHEPARRARKCRRIPG